MAHPLTHPSDVVFSVSPFLSTLFMITLVQCTWDNFYQLFFSFYHLNILPIWNSLWNKMWDILVLPIYCFSRWPPVCPNTIYWTLPVFCTDMKCCLGDSQVDFNSVSLDWCNSAFSCEISPGWQRPPTCHWKLQTSQTCNMLQVHTHEYIMSPNCSLKCCEHALLHPGTSSTQELMSKVVGNSYMVFGWLFYRFTPLTCEERSELNICKSLWTMEKYYCNSYAIFFDFKHVIVTSAF